MPRRYLSCDMCYFRHLNCMERCKYFQILKMLLARLPFIRHNIGKLIICEYICKLILYLWANYYGHAKKWQWNSDLFSELTFGSHKKKNSFIGMLLTILRDIYLVLHILRFVRKISSTPGTVKQNNIVEINTSKKENYL